MTGPAQRGSPAARPLVDALLAPYEVLVPPVSTAGAAVTIVLRDGASGPEVLLIERTSNDADPASGQVALPGGRVEDGDGSLLETALRELAEEVGLAGTDLDGPPRFVRTELAARFGLRVGIFAGRLSSTAGTPTPRSRDEVAHVFWLPAAQLAETSLVREETPRGAIEVAASVYEGHVLWGFTRRVLRDFFALPVEGELGGPAFPPRPIEDAPPPEEGRQAPE